MQDTAVLVGVAPEDVLERAEVVGEVGAPEAAHAHVGHRTHARLSRLVEEQRELAEVFAGAEVRDDAGGGGRDLDDPTSTLKGAW